MSLLVGDTGKVAYGNLRTFNLQTATPNEVSLGTLSLPNVEGTTNQVSFTVQNTDLPTITPNLLSMKYLACMVVSGKCVSVAIVNFRIFKNGTPIITSSSGGVANQFWTHNHWRWYDVQVGDVLEVRLWSSQADTILDYACLIIYPASMVFSKPGTILKDFTYTNQTNTNYPNPTGAGLRTLSVANTANLNVCLAPNVNAVGSGAGCWGVGVTSGTPLIINALQSTSFGTIRAINGGDGGATVTQAYNHATSINLQKQGFPNTVTFREVLR